MPNTDPVKITGLTDIVTVLKNIATLQGQIYQVLVGVQNALSGSLPAPVNSSGSWTPGAVTNGSSVVQTLTITGAVAGSYVLASVSVDLQQQTLQAYVSATNTVKVVLTNNTGGTITLGTVTLNVRVFAP